MENANGNAQSSKEKINWGDLVAAVAENLFRRIQNHAPRGLQRRLRRAASERVIAPILRRLHCESPVEFVLRRDFPAGGPGSSGEKRPGVAGVQDSGESKGGRRVLQRYIWIGRWSAVEDEVEAEFEVEVEVELLVGVELGGVESSEAGDRRWRGIVFIRIKAQVSCVIVTANVFGSVNLEAQEATFTCNLFKMGGTPQQGGVLWRWKCDFS